MSAVVYGSLAVKRPRTCYQSKAGEVLSDSAKLSGRIFSLFQLEAANAMRYHAHVPIKIPMVIALRNTQAQW